VLFQTARWISLGFALGILPVAKADEEPLYFETDVRPILREHCVLCHGEEGKPKSGLDLRLARTMIEGGLTGEAVYPGDAEGSFLWARIDADEMPPGDTKLSQDEKAIIRRWIDQGARTVRPEPEDAPPPGLIVTEEDRAFWAFQPIERSDVPEPADGDRASNPIDAFLLRALEARGLGFGPEADKRTLIRRATFDLTGLPPTPGEIEAFLADDRPGAYERLIDRLLASPAYGERWARHWMDVAGYADSEGYTLADPVRPWAYRYRDYLIRSINADRPWDELIIEQLAGDELLEPPYEDLSPEDRDRLIATGFLRMAPDGTADRSVDPTAARNDAVAETIKIVSTSLLGLTVGCAQCHAHRYDPISHEDYYRFRALFEPAYDPSNWRTPPQRLVSLWTDTEREQNRAVDEKIKAITAERNAAVDELVEQVLERELDVAPEALRPRLREARATPKGKRTEEQIELLKAYPRVLVTRGNVSLYDAKAHREVIKRFSEPLAEANAERPAPNNVRALTEVPDQVPETRLFERGDPNQPGPAVEPGELSILEETTGSAGIPANDPQRPTTGRRLAYARHLTRGDHPLVARVLVNRVWLNHFGTGLVATPGDFGRLGERPSHPELLDWLADTFMRNEWRLKHLHRLIMTSTAYRQSAARRLEHDRLDPENRLLGRMPVKRLEAEAVRDALLAASGGLTRRLYGPPVPVAPDQTGQYVIGRDNRDSAGRPTGDLSDLGADARRRTLYVQQRRTMPLSLTEPFDPPETTPNCERRNTSTVAPQALMMLNNAFVIRRSEALADRLRTEHPDDAESRIRAAWLRATGREPSADQIDAARAFLARQRAVFAERPEAADKQNPIDPDRQALASYCQALLASNPFLYVD